MATKQELENELADLRAQLKARDEEREAESKAREEMSDSLEAETAASAETLSLELPEGALQDFANEIETLAKDKPILTILAAVLVGYIIGRSR